MTLRCEIATVSPRRSNAKQRVLEELHVVMNLHMQVLTFVYLKVSHTRPCIVAVFFARVLKLRRDSRICRHETMCLGGLCQGFIFASVCLCGVRVFMHSYHLHVCPRLRACAHMCCAGVRACECACLCVCWRPFYPHRGLLWLFCPANL